MRRSEYLRLLAANPAAAAPPRNSRSLSPAAMVVEYGIAIGGKVHHLSIALPGSLRECDLAQMQRFAITTAWLQHVGYLPWDCVNAVE